MMRGDEVIGEWLELRGGVGEVVIPLLMSCQRIKNKEVERRIGTWHMNAGSGGGAVGLNHQRTHRLRFPRIFEKKLGGVRTGSRSRWKKFAVLHGTNRTVHMQEGNEYKSTSCDQFNAINDTIR